LKKKKDGEMSLELKEKFKVMFDIINKEQEADFIQ